MQADDIDLDIDAKLFAEFNQIAHRWTGITLPANRKTMLQGRLRPRMRQLNIRKYSEYLSFLLATPDEKQIFINRITTNETYFYRTPRIWEFIGNEFLPQWYSRARPDATLNVWSAAASTGEEAYTLGMTFEALKQKNPDFKYQIVGTDISQETLDRAAQGLYSGRSVETLRNKKPDFFHSFLQEGQPGIYSVSSKIRSRVTFTRHNLFENLKRQTSFDLVLLRNVLIYFQAADQESVLRRISQSMLPGATLIIGESESLNNLDSPFLYQSPLIYSFPDKKSEAA